MQDIVGKVLKIENGFDELGRFHCADIIDSCSAYIKGKNGHYYLYISSYSVAVYRVQRRTQQNAEWIQNLKSGTEAELISQFQACVANHKPFRKKIRVKDMQRNRVYRWEAQCGMASNRVAKHLSRQEVVDLVERISCEYGLTVAPKITYRKANFSAAYGCHTIQLGHTELATVVHEMAHIIDSFYHKNESHQGHGPSFVGCLMTLNEQFLGYSQAMMVEKAKEQKVKYDNFVNSKRYELEANRLQSILKAA